MTGIDADEIVRLRDVEHCDWNTIEKRMGYHKITCKVNYGKRKNGCKYIEELNPFILQIPDIGDLHAGAILAVCKVNGFSIGLSNLKLHMRKGKIPYKGSKARAENLRDEVISIIRNNPSLSVDEAMLVIAGACSRELYLKIGKEVANAV